MKPTLLTNEDADITLGKGQGREWHFYNMETNEAIIINVDPFSRSIMSRVTSSIATAVSNVAGNLIDGWTVYGSLSDDAKKAIMDNKEVFITGIVS